MIIFEDKGFQTRSDMPDTDWTGKSKYIVPDGSELSNKIISLYPYYEFVIDENGSLIDVVETERPEQMTLPEPEDTESDIMSMTVDHEYRLTLLELGITGE